ncbi:hypothetical protein MLD38_020195 [Melastoma candidum]|uniref:Uncharacterized protein n=1 Tax=Melastoma candidum TaxID=119954 RepID=A0ACB9QBP0_9MYRT|nr:hypothetical protein MLD38_020195 [Melastoma candidum]
MASPTALSDVPDDVLLHHVLTLLDPTTLASFSCVSARFRSLVASSSLWSLLCAVTWPSTRSQLLRHVIPSFPSHDPHLCFFSQSYTVIASDPGSRPRSGRGIGRLISAVDLRYRGDIVFSRAAETETSSSWFVQSPFRIDLLDPKEAVPTPIPSLDTPGICLELRDDLTLSWIAVDPEGKRAVNLSSHRAVSVERHWLSGEVEARFSSVLGGDERGTSREYVEMVVTVKLGGYKDKEGATEVREVSVRGEDMEGNGLKGGESLRAVEAGGFGGRRIGGGRGRHEGLWRERKEEWGMRKARNEGRLDGCLCVVFGMAAAALGFWSFSWAATFITVFW